MQPEAQAALRRVWLKQELARYRQRSEAQPDQIEVWRQIGRICWEMNEPEQAVAALERALALQPEDGESLLGLMVACWALDRVEETLVASVRLLRLLPPPVTSTVQFSAACLQVRALVKLRRFDEADAVLDDLQNRYPHRTLEMEFEPWRLPGETLPDSLPKRYTARGLYMIDFFAAQAHCDWRDRDVVLENIEDFTADALRYGFVAGIEPFSLLALPIEPALQLAVARAQATAVAARMAPIRERLSIEWPTVPRDGRLRIGYVSGDFREHPTAHLARKLFQMHDRSRFEVVGFSLRPGDGSHYWRDIVAGCDRFVELADLSHAESALRIAQEGIHILVDMHGYTRFARPELFALRPAPVQVAFLGYPGTLGADAIPYIVADPVVLPETLRPFFTEQPIYLECYQVNDDEQPIAQTGLTRTAAGLPEEGFVYCCFNSSHKIEPGAFGIWMRILQQTPGSVLWLLAHTPGCTEHLRAAAAARGIAPERLIFAPRLPKAEHLKRHQLADLFLDSFVYNAHTTASDALWAGLPVVTRTGRTFQSRVCTSLLSALGLSEWATGNEQDYEQLAVALAHDLGRLRDFRMQLAECRLTSPLFMTERFVRGLEQAFMALGDVASSGANQPDSL